MILNILEPANIFSRFTELGAFSGRRTMQKNIRYGNKDIGLWISRPPSRPTLLHVSVLPVQNNQIPNSRERRERGIAVRYLHVDGFSFVVYQQDTPNGNVLGASITARF